MPNETKNGIQKEEVLFQRDPEIKEEWLDTQKKSTRSFYSYVLFKADEYENEINKSIYDFNIEDRDELLLVKFKNKSIGAFQSNLTPLKKYIDFCIFKNLVRSNENRFASILTDDYGNYVSLQAMEAAYIPKSENREMQKKLVNEQDQLILELLGCVGARGRTEKGNTLEELINLKVEDVKWDKKMLYLINNDGELRYVYVDDYTLDLIKRTINKSFYYFNNGFNKKKNEHGEYDKTEKGFIINPTEYVFRVPGRNKFGKTDHQLFANRMQKMQRYLEKPYLTVSNLYFSAMIDYAKKLKEEKGELTKEDYIRINERFNFGGGDNEKYYYKTRELVNLYI